MSKDELQDEITSLLGADEEYAIHDYENELFAVNEFDNPYTLNKIACELELLEHHRKLPLTIDMSIIRGSLRSD